MATTLQILKTFPKGGVHPFDNKSKTAGKAIEPLKLPEVLIIPLQQHIGAPNEALVKKGDLVKKGQKIGDAKAFISAPVHASTSGKVLKVEIAPHPIGKPSLAVFIEPDGEDSLFEEIKPCSNWQALEADKIKNLIREAGLVGMGGATFPTHVKLSPPKEKPPIDTVILNGVECEPFLTADHRLMLEEPEEILDGLAIIMKVLNVKKGFIGIEANKSDAIEIMSKAASKREGMEVVPLVVKYPQGAEKQLIKAILNREVPPPPGLPMDVGVIVQNVGTSRAIATAVKAGLPLIERVTTVTGSVNNPKNLRTRIGTPVKFVLDAAGGLKMKKAKVIGGGPMMGIAISSLDTPITKGSSGILVQSEEDLVTDLMQVCIRCGSCIKVCPMNLLPSIISQLCENERYEETEKYNVIACIECGCCAFVCPSKRYLVHQFKHAKNIIMAAIRKRQAA